MRTDDPAILQQIRQLEQTAEALRRICGFTPLNPTPETTARRAPHWCTHPGCAFGFRTQQDLDHHLANEHA